jgi:hypothetical protein
MVETITVVNNSVRTGERSIATAGGSQPVQWRLQVLRQGADVPLTAIQPIAQRCQVSEVGDGTNPSRRAKR